MALGDPRQLIVKHIMFGPDWDAPCPSCRHFITELSKPVLARLHSHDTTFVLVCRGPVPKIEAFRADMGRTPPWYSSYGTDFNYDFQVTLDESVPQLMYNYRSDPASSAVSGQPRCPASAASCETTVRSSTPTSARSAPAANCPREARQ